MRIPYSVPSTMTAIRVKTARTNSNLSYGQTAASALTWMIREPTNVRMAPSVALGRSVRAVAKKRINRVMIPTATRLAICDRPPDDATTAVRGGLESIGKEPTNDAAAEPTPIAMKSLFMLTS